MVEYYIMLMMIVGLLEDNGDKGFVQILGIFFGANIFGPIKGLRPDKSFGVLKGAGHLEARATKALWWAIFQVPPPGRGGEEWGMEGHFWPTPARRSDHN